MQSCAGDDEGTSGITEDYLDRLRRYSQKQRDYIERFNAVAKEIRDFPPAGKDIEKYFHVFKNVAKLEDAQLFFFGEIHDHAFNQLWSAGAMNRLVTKKSVALFEGAQSGTKVVNIEEHISTGIFAAREYENLKAHKTYGARSISKMEAKYADLFYATKPMLALNILNLNQATGIFWDLMQGKDLHPSYAKRNETMVATIKDNLDAERILSLLVRPIFLTMSLPKVIYKAKQMGMLPAFLASSTSANDRIINDAFFNYFPTSTKSIFDFIKGQKFAVLIPKNLPTYESYKNFFPTNAD